MGAKGEEIVDDAIYGGLCDTFDLGNRGDIQPVVQV